MFPGRDELIYSPLVIVNIFPTCKSEWLALPKLGGGAFLLRLKFFVYEE